jgi:3-deoxy-manno-octulosonate cytidylyltransferase (CMP-KDO synthetase)
MIIRVANICSKVVSRQNLFIATDSIQIARLIKKYNFNYIMTSADHLTGTDRLFEASKKIKANIYINVQGDEPIIKPKDIKKVILEKNKNKKFIVCGYCKLKKHEKAEDTDIPKVVINEKNFLLYISRNAVPFSKKKTKKINYFKQVCIYGFTKNDLEIFNNLKRKSNIEKIEDIEILRFLDLGKKIKMVKVSNQSIAVDKKKDILKVEKFLNEKKN